MNNTDSLALTPQLEFKVLDRLKESGKELTSGPRQSCNNNC